MIEQINIKIKLKLNFVLKMANNPLKKFKKLQSTNYDDKIKPRNFQKVQVKVRRRQSNFDNLQLTVGDKLKELIEENEESFFQDEDINNISFELSNVNDMEDLLDNFSNKSDEKINLEFESTTNEEGIQLIDEFLKESTKQIVNNRKKFDKDVVNMTEEYYNNLVNEINMNIIPSNTTKQVNKNFERMDSVNSNSINIITEKNLSIKKNYLNNLDKRGSNILSESMTSEDNYKLRKDLIGQSDNTTQSNGKFFSFATKNKSISKFIMDNLDDDKIIQIRKKKPEE